MHTFSLVCPPLALHFLHWLSCRWNRISLPRPLPSFLSFPFWLSSSSELERLGNEFCDSFSFSSSSCVIWTRFQHESRVATVRHAFEISNIYSILSFVFLFDWLISRFTILILLMFLSEKSELSKCSRTWNSLISHCESGKSSSLWWGESGGKCKSITRWKWFSMQIFPSPRLSKWCSTTTIALLTGQSASLHPIHSFPLFQVHVFPSIDEGKTTWKPFERETFSFPSQVIWVRQKEIFCPPSSLAYDKDILVVILRFFLFLFLGLFFHPPFRFPILFFSCYSISFFATQLPLSLSYAMCLSVCLSILSHFMFYDLYPPSPFLSSHISLYCLSYVTISLWEKGNSESVSGSPEKGEATS